MDLLYGLQTSWDTRGTGDGGYERDREGWGENIDIYNANV